MMGLVKWRYDPGQRNKRHADRMTGSDTAEIN
jgi:hypothetical protein